MSEDSWWHQKEYEYLSVEIIELKKRIALALEHSMSGQCDGGHHKAYSIDQIVRALTGCPMVDQTATNVRGEDYTYRTQGESEEYQEFIKEYQGEFDEKEEMYEYEWDVGIP